MATNKNQPRTGGGVNKSIKTNEKIRAEVMNLLNKFKDPDALAFIAKSMFKRGVEVPSDKWSYRNRLIMFCRNTDDARGFNAWAKAKRKVKAGKCFYILAPRMIQVEQEVIDENTGETKFEKVPKCIGFIPMPVWAYENTEGQEVDYKFDKPQPKYLGTKVAEKLGLEIKQTTGNLQYDGLYTGKEIKMATDDQQVFFHELAHAVDHKIFIGDKYKDETKAEKEIIAEFSSAVLMQIFGIKYSEKSVYDYIRNYSQTGEEIVEAVFPLLDRTAKIVSYVMNELEESTETVNEKTN